MADEREQQIRTRLERGTLTPCRWLDSDIQFVLDALAAAREENRRLREALEKINAVLQSPAMEEAEYAVRMTLADAPDNAETASAKRVITAALAREATDADR